MTVSTTLSFSYELLEVWNGSHRADTLGEDKANKMDTKKQTLDKRTKVFDCTLNKDDYR